jgi:hypothetical protein
MKEAVAASAAAASAAAESSREAAAAAAAAAAREEANVSAREKDNYTDSAQIASLEGEVVEWKAMLGAKDKENRYVYIYFFYI